MSDKPPLRQLRLIIARGPSPFLVSAVLVGEISCTAGGGDHLGNTQSRDDSPGLSTTSESPMSASSPTSGLTNATSPAGPSAISPEEGIITVVTPEPTDDVYTIDVPDAGAIPAAGEVCGLQLGELQNTGQLPVTFSAPEPDRAIGVIEVKAELQTTLVGTPSIEIVDSAGFMNPSVSEVTPHEKGYQFDFNFPPRFGCAFGGITWVTLRVTYSVQCEEGVRELHSVTEQHLCVDESTGDNYWATSGTCVAPGICRVIAEMAPSPIVPDAVPDDLPLARVIRLRVVELARIANSVLLWAENDGGAEAEYGWHVTGGEVQKLAPDLVLWTLHQGLSAPLAQVSVCNEHAAAVVSWAFNREVV